MHNRNRQCLVAFIFTQKVSYLSEEMKTTAVGNLYTLDAPEFPVWNKGPTLWGERIMPASAETNESAQLWIESSGANSTITESPDARTLKFETSNNKVLCEKFVVRQQKNYLAGRGIPPRADIIGSDKRDSAFLIALASKKALPHKTREGISISAAINPLFDWDPTPIASTTRKLHSEN